MTHRFGVYFFAAGMVPNPLDIRFQEVSGMGATISTKPDPTSVSSISKRVTPTGIAYDNLELKRGVVIGSPLSLQIQQVLNEFQFFRSDVLVTVFSELGIPTMAWKFCEAFPVAWQLASLNAKGEEVLIESLSLTYASMRLIQL
jgi:hypothetical protein